jgi:hypothetical protein
MLGAQFSGAMATATTSPSSSLLEALPLLVLESICEYLTHGDSKRRSLFAFSLTSKCCCFAALSQRFERVRFKLRGRKKLRQDLDRWDTILGIDGRARYVRRVKVVGYMSRLQVDETGEEREVAEAFQLQTDRDEDEDEDENEEEMKSDGDNFCGPLKGIIRDFNGGNPPLVTQKERQDQNEAWLPLAHFFDQLPALKDLIYACTDQIPICILSSLHRYHPNCRLHVHTFSLRSLYQPKDSPHDIDPDEFVLATSPCLHSIVVSCYGYDTIGQVDYNQEAVLQMVAAAAPRLKSVCMFSCHPGVSMAFEDACRTRRPLWQGFFVASPGESSRPTRSKGRLESLALHNLHSPISEQLTAWGNHTDFSRLRSIEIWCQVSLEAIQTLTQMAEDGGFHSLHTLSLSISTSVPHEEQHIDEAASLLLQTLYPLEHLRLRGFVAEQTFTTVLHRHGASLRRLQFIPSRKQDRQVAPFVVSQYCIHALQERCPDLQEVELLVTRTKGDDQEVSIYRALGTLQGLKRASLFLDCSHFPSRMANGRRLLDERQKAFHMREDLINSAIDSSLALAIFRVISATNNLEYLRLQVPRGRNPGREWEDEDFSNIVQWIARRWFCTRDPGGEIIVMEIGKRERMEWVKSDYLETDLEEYYHGELYTRVREEIWPDTRTGDWKEDWRSLPLSGEEVAI